MKSADGRHKMKNERDRHSCPQGTIHKAAVKSSDPLLAESDFLSDFQQKLKKDAAIQAAIVPVNIREQARTKIVMSRTTSLYSVLGASSSAVKMPATIKGGPTVKLHRSKDDVVGEMWDRFKGRRRSTTTTTTTTTTTATGTTPRSSKRNRWSA
eukprot:Blabericola_migrator_1__425@NODE_1101_length_5433_cov_95_739657_g754_i0_p4_GENE_NODE_1101_length_5433_cov_95_739657_g754_i0NODE_1101_length_5433_cov_95_739657_g754_i0_p4_ORF_typecomplete_len154_score18_77_NODE_1101_length_5433_cov_95_739657_g754_i026213082